MSKLGRKYILGTSGLSLKAVAFALLLKDRMGKGGFVRDYSYNKLAAMTSTSPSTVKKYMSELFAQGIAYIEGKGNLRIAKMHSNSNHRNIVVDQLCLRSFKDAYRSVQAFAFLLKQASKDCVKSATRSLANPASLGLLKKARRFCSSMVSAVKGAHSFIYRELGLSYNKIAQICTVCAKTAQKVVNYAISMGWCSKQNHSVSHFMPGLNHRDMSEFGYTFSTESYAYKILANTYSLSPSIAGDLYIHGTL